MISAVIGYIGIVFFAPFVFVISWLLGRILVGYKRGNRFDIVSMIIKITLFLAISYLAYEPISNLVMYSMFIASGIGLVSGLSTQAFKSFN